MEEIGLFRRSASTATFKQVKEAYNRGMELKQTNTCNFHRCPLSGHPVSLEKYHDAHLAAVLLKSFFRDLPTPIISEDCYPIIRRCPTPAEGDMACITYVRENILPALGSYAGVILLSYVLREYKIHSLSCNVHK
ncbi:MAG TPA: RhoGAP domain-containing protein [Chlamydiales bacterium]|nr:RhoGAP domain-containing protein [Chlamydiales bacterium]